MNLELLNGRMNQLQYPGKIDPKLRNRAALITEATERYITKMNVKLDNSETAPKTYWSLINRFLNSKYSPIIPTILISDFQKKVKLFKNLFPSQCTPVRNASR